MLHSFDTSDAEKWGINAAILIHNLKNWIRVNKANGRNYYDGHYWTYNTAKAFSQLFPYLSEDTIRKTLKKLEKNGVILIGHFNKSGFDRTNWYAFTDESFLNNIKPGRPENRPKKRVMHSAKLPDGKRKRAASDSENLPDVNYTDSNTDKKPDGGEEALSLSLFDQKPSWADVLNLFISNADKSKTPEERQQLGMIFWYHCEEKGWAENWQAAAKKWMVRDCDPNWLKSLGHKTQRNSNQLPKKQSIRHNPAGQMDSQTLNQISSAIDRAKQQASKISLKAVLHNDCVHTEEHTSGEP